MTNKCVVCQKRGKPGDCLSFHRMALELILLGALIFIFIVSFCGLLQKIKQTYERERLLAERLARRREQERTRPHSTDLFEEIYINPAFSTESNGTAVFPAAPPPYSQYYIDQPPKYEEIIKVHQQQTTTANQDNENSSTITENLANNPPPYTINVVTEINNNRH